VAQQVAEDLLSRWAGSEEGMTTFKELVEQFAAGVIGTIPFGATEFRAPAFTTPQIEKISKPITPADIKPKEEPITPVITKPEVKEEVKPEEPKVSESLAEEAKKYKSAEEFVDDITKRFSKDAQLFDPKKLELYETTIDRNLVRKIKKTNKIR